MIYKVVLRKESLGHSSQRLNFVFTISSSDKFENDCYTTETDPCYNLVDYNRAPFCHRKKGVSVKFKTAEVWLGIPFSYEETEKNG